MRLVKKKLDTCLILRSPGLSAGTSSGSYAINQRQLIRHPFPQFPCKRWVLSFCQLTRPALRRPGSRASARSPGQQSLDSSPDNTSQVQHESRRKNSEFGAHHRGGSSTARRSQDPPCPPALPCVRTSKALPVAVFAGGGGGACVLSVGLTTSQVCSAGDAA